MFSVIGSGGLMVYLWGKEKYNRRLQLKMVLRHAEKKEQIKQEENAEKEEDKSFSSSFLSLEEAPEAQKEFVKREKIENELASDTEILKMIKQAQTKIGMQEYEDAEKILIQVLSYHDLHREALEMMGHLYLLLDKPAKSVFFLEQHLENHVANPTVYTNYALANLYLQNYDESVKYYGKAIDMDPSNPIRYANLGHVLLTLNHFNDAIRCFQEALKLDPRNREYHTIIADTLRANHHFAEAKEWYLKILAFSPYDAHAQTELERLNALGF